MGQLIDMRNTRLYIRDKGTNYIEVRVGEGNLTYTEKRNIIYGQSRGVMDRVNEGNEEGLSIQFQFMWDSIKTHTGDPVSVEDALKKINAASGWASTASNPDSIYCVDMQLDFTPGCDNFQESIYFSQFNYENLAHSWRDGTVDCGGTCNFKRAIAS